MSDYADDIRKFSLVRLTADRQEFRDAIVGFNAVLADIQNEIDRRFSNAGKLALDTAGKDYGTITREVENGYKIKADIKQTVKWDGAALQAIAADMTWEKIQHWFKIDFSVPEAKFKAIEPGPFRKAIEKARTTKLSPIKITLSDPES